MISEITNLKIKLINKEVDNSEKIDYFELKNAELENEMRVKEAEYLNYKEETASKILSLEEELKFNYSKVMNIFICLGSIKLSLYLIFKNCN